MMRIGYDAKRIFFNNTGLGNYGRTLVHTLATLYPEHSYQLFSARPSNNPRLAALLRASTKIQPVFPSVFIGKKVPSLWRSFLINNDIEKNNIQIFHGLSHELPVGIEKLNKVRTVVTMHDLIFERYPNFFPFFDRKVYRYKFTSAVRRADCIVAISEQTKRDLMDFYAVSGDRIEVVYQSCDGIFSEKTTLDTRLEVRSKYNLPKDFLLYVGSITERKNLLTIVKALHALEGRLDVPLVVIGDGGAYKQIVVNYLLDNQLNKNIIFLKNISFTDLPAIYQSARALLYPSVFEGFGIPIIEALHSRTPVVTSAGGCFVEAGGDAAFYVNPLDVDELADGILRVCSDDDLRKTMVDKGSRYVQRFAPEVLGRQWIELYKKLI